MKEDEKFKNASDLEDGVYQNIDATFFVKDGRILMKLKGQQGLHRTTKNFMLGAKRLWGLSEPMQKDFDPAYEKAPSW